MGHDGKQRDVLACISPEFRYPYLCLSNTSEAPELMVGTFGGVIVNPVIGLRKTEVILFGSNEPLSPSCRWVDLFRLTILKMGGCTIQNNITLSS